MVGQYFYIQVLELEFYYFFLQEKWGYLDQFELLFNKYIYDKDSNMLKIVKRKIFCLILR